MPDTMDVESLIETWRGPLVGLLTAWGASRGEATELAQDAIAEAWLGRARLRGDAADPRTMGPWLTGIARNLWRARLRRVERRREQPLEGDHATRSVALADARLEPLRSAIARLPDDLRTVVHARYLEDTPVRTVAALLGVPESTVEGRLYRARKLLREQLAHHVTGSGKTS